MQTENMESNHANGKTSLLETLIFQNIIKDIETSEKAYLN